MNIKLRFVCIILGVFVTWKCTNYLVRISGVNTEIDQTSSLLNNIQSTVDVRASVAEVVKLAVYYETLCSDSRNFFVKQLNPIYEKLREHVIVDLVPYGKAKTIEVNGKINFQCQHSTIECLGNKIHACALDIIKDPLLQTKYVTCMISDNIVPFEAAERCAQEFNIDYHPIIDCTNDPKRADQLLKGHGLRTNSVKPDITFIPTVQITNIAGVPISPQPPLSKLLKDLYKEICGIFVNTPPVCK